MQMDRVKVGQLLVGCLWNALKGSVPTPHVRCFQLCRIKSKAALSTRLTLQRLLLLGVAWCRSIAHVIASAPHQASV